MKKILIGILAVMLAGCAVPKAYEDKEKETKEQDQVTVIDDVQVTYSDEAIDGGISEKEDRTVYIDGVKVTYNPNAMDGGIDLSNYETEDGIHYNLKH